MKKKTLIGVDLGGTSISLGRVVNSNIEDYKSVKISANDSEKKIINEIIDEIDSVFRNEIAGIGIGVPGLVDIEKGIIYDVQNIPSWKEVHLKEILEEKFKLPVYINNDANCFAVGVKYFGRGEQFRDMVGLTIGTGLGAGIIINDRIYTGANCGAGEFGSIAYMNKNIEYYCSGQFFKNIYHIRGEELFEKARSGERESLAILNEYGKHLGNAITMILFAVDPQAIFLGGSVSFAYPYFRDAMWEQISLFPYKHVLKNLVIEVANQPNIAILGAAALYFNSMNI